MNRRSIDETTEVEKAIYLIPFNTCTKIKEVATITIVKVARSTFLTLAHQ